jgi:hypothetical protein
VKKKKKKRKKKKGMIGDVDDYIDDEIQQHDRGDHDVVPSIECNGCPGRISQWMKPLSWETLENYSCFQ